MQAETKEQISQETEIQDKITGAMHMFTYFQVTKVLRKVQLERQAKKAFPKAFANEPKGLDKILEEETKERCELSSIFTLYWLKKHYSHLFTNMFIMRTDDEVPNESGVKEKKETRGWKYHARFVVKGVDGKWYSGSPANYPTGEYNEESREHLDIESADSLLELLNKIRLKDKYLWPNVDPKIIEDENEYMQLQITNDKMPEIIEGLQPNLQSGNSRFGFKVLKFKEENGLTTHEVMQGDMCYLEDASLLKIGNGLVLIRF